MSDDEIEKIAAQLESVARVEDAKFRLDEVWDNENAISDHIVANRTGFLYLAALLLRGAIAEENVVSDWILPIKNEVAGPFFDKMERREHWEGLPEEDAPSSTKERIIELLEGIGCYSVAALTVFLIIIGFVTVWEWIF